MSYTTLEEQPSEFWYAIELERLGGVGNVQ